MHWNTLCVAGLLAGAAAPLFAQPRLGVIDLKRVFDGYYKTQAADADLKKRGAELEKDAKALRDQLQKAADDYKRALDEANDQALSADEREKRKKAAEGKLLEIKTHQQTLEDFDRTARTSLAEQERSLREKILTEIRTVINARAKAAGYSLVVDTAAETINRTPVVLFHNGENDLTSTVLSELNAAAPPSFKADDKRDRK